MGIQRTLLSGQPHWRQPNVLETSCKSLFLTGLQDCAGYNKIMIILNLLTIRNKDY